MFWLEAGLCSDRRNIGGVLPIAIGRNISNKNTLRPVSLVFLHRKSAVVRHLPSPDQEEMAQRKQEYPKFHKTYLFDINLFDCDQ